MSQHLKASARLHSCFNLSTIFEILFKENNETHCTVRRRFVSLSQCRRSGHCSASGSTRQQQHGGASCFDKTGGGLSSPKERSEIFTTLKASADSRLITDLDGDAVVKTCLAISQSEVPPDIQLRRLLASQLNSCIGELRTETALSCLKILIFTEDTEECRWAAEKEIRNCKGAVWSRAVNLNAVLNHFKEMAPKVSNVDFVNLFECCVEVGISTREALDVFLPEIVRRFQLKALSEEDEAIRSPTKKQRGSNSNSPEIVGLILRSCEICQQARVLGRANVGLSNK